MSCQAGVFNEKNSSRVLRPPGGGSSDIFGSYSAPAQTPPRPNHMRSNIFGEEGGDAGMTTPLKRPSARGGDGTPGGQSTHVFGESEPSKQPPSAREDTQDNIFGSEGGPTENGDRNSLKDELDEEDEESNNGETLKTSDDTMQSVTSNKRASYNPITGGEDDLPKPTTKPNAEAQSHTSTRIRQPPGGASSGLW